MTPPDFLLVVVAFVSILALWGLTAYSYINPQTPW